MGNTTVTPGVYTNVGLGRESPGEEAVRLRMLAYAAQVRAAKAAAKTATKATVGLAA